MPTGEADYRALANALPQIVWISDAQGRLAWLNERWTEYTGISSDDLSETSWRGAIHPQDVDGLLARWRTAVAEGRSYELEYRLKDREGQFRWHLARLFPVRDPATGAVARWVAAATDIDERRRAEAAIRRSEQEARARADELAALMDVVPAAVWISHDPACEHVDGNRAGHEMLRAPADANLSKTAVDASGSAHFTVWKDGVELPPEELPLQTAARTGEPVRDFAEELRFSNGETIHIYGNAYPLLDEQARPRGAVAAFIDVTRLRETEAALRLAARRKDEFLAILSHELRNPLAPILTAVELMRRRGDVASPNERAVIERQAQHLARLVDDLLDVSRVARGKITLHRAPRELRPLVDRAVDETSALFEERRHALRVDVAPSGLLVDCDEVRLVQVMTNLLANAARYTPPGGHVDIGATRANDQVVLRVRDDGVGIAPELLPEIFDMFVQGPRTVDRSEGGLGLGLALVKRLVELQGGTAEARSAGAGRGSEFTVRLPEARSAGASAAREPREAAAPIERSRRLLVVDDNEDNAELLVDLLREAGHVVELALDPSAALALIETFRPEVAILDIGLPVMDGYELAAAMRARLGAAAPAFVALSGYGRDEDRRRSDEAGFSAHLVKPVRSEDLLELVDTLPR